MTRPAGYYTIRKPLRPWVCPLCEREVTQFTMWDDDGVSAVYFHGDNERHFVSNHRDGDIVAHISEIDKHRENT
jgi:hypothetical protein